jgi:uncharacterized Zn finger protein
MKPWEFEWRRTAKQPPPEHGLKIKKAGTTWWGKRWLDALEVVLRGDGGRLARGRSYARAGRVHELGVAGGSITAQVTGSRPTPYTVRLELRALDEAIWTRVLAALAEKAQFSAELLAGRMPEAIDEVFRSARASLFPRERAELVTECSCPDSGDPCKHVAATHYVLGEALDRDPFLLFELRGKTKAQVLAALRAARAATTPAARAPRAKRTAAKPAPAARHTAPRQPSPPSPRATPARPSAEAYDRLPSALPSLHFSFEEPATHGAMLKQLGAPAAWHGTQSLADALSPVVSAASEAARRLARSEPAAPEEPTRPTKAARYRRSSARRPRNTRASRSR